MLKTVVLLNILVETLILFSGFFSSTFQFNLNLLNESINNNNNNNNKLLNCSVNLTIPKTQINIYFIYVPCISSWIVFCLKLNYIKDHLFNK